MAWNPFARRPQAPNQLQARRAERHDAHGLRCALGELTDLSTTGMRVTGEGKCPIDVGQMLPLVISNGGQSIRVQAEVVWVTKRAFGRGKFEVGLKFRDVRKSLAGALEQFARFGCVNTSSFASMYGTAEEQPAGSPASTGQATPPVSRVEVENLYAILGIQPDATDQDIRRAFHKLAMQYHPDRNQSPDAVDKFESINKTYLVLKDPEKRRRYDELVRRSA
ncbi:MAG: DnaJ domain-containing protein [Phycisphaerales bacterium]